MQRQQLDRFRSAVLIVIVGVLMSACVDVSRRGVGVKSLAADLVFGIPTLEEAVTPPNLGTLGVSGTADTGPPDLRTQRRIPAGVTGAKSCPDAEVNEVEANAGDDVTGGPAKIGKYRWKQSGTQDLGPAIGKFAVPNFANRLVTESKRLNATDSEFTTVHEDARGEVKQTFQVIQSRPRTQPQTPVLGGTPNVIRDESVTNGIFLTRIARPSPTIKGGEEVFTPNPPVLYIPLPVVIGFERTTQASDSDSLQVMTHHIHVLNRQRYDACGKLVDGILVDADQRFSDQDETFTADFDYAVATQMGGLFVFEHVETPCPARDANNKCVDPDLVLDTNIGQLEPDPLG
jgi:hypothetical protein